MRSQRCRGGLRSRSGNERVIHRRKPVIIRNLRCECRVVIQKWNVGEGLANFSSGDTKWLAACFGLQNICVREPWVIARDGDVQAVLEGQLYRVLQRQLQLA